MCHFPSSRPLALWALALALVQASPGDVVYRCLRLDARAALLAAAVGALYKQQRLSALLEARRLNRSSRALPLARGGCSGACRTLAPALDCRRVRGACARALLSRPLIHDAPPRRRMALGGVLACPSSEAGAARGRPRARTFAAGLVQLHASWACAALDNWARHRCVLLPPPPPPPPRSSASRRPAAEEGGAVLLTASARRAALVASARLAAADGAAGARRLWARVAGPLSACVLALLLAPPATPRPVRGALRLALLALFARRGGVRPAFEALRAKWRTPQNATRKTLAQKKKKR